MPKAMASGRATSPTVMPARRSCRNICAEYWRRDTTSLGRFGLLRDIGLAFLPGELLLFYAELRRRLAKCGTQRRWSNWASLSVQTRGFTKISAERLRA